MASRTNYVLLIGRRILLRKPGQATRQIGDVFHKIEPAVYETAWYRQLWINTARAQLGIGKHVAVLQLLAGGKVE